MPSSEFAAAAAAVAPRSGWQQFWQIFSGVVIVLTFVVVLISCIFVAKQDGVFRVCFVQPGIAAGMLDFDADHNALSYRLSRPANASAVTSIRLRGPLGADLQTGPIAAVLCGAPSGLACMGSNQTQYAVYIEASGTPNDMMPLRKAVRSTPYLYYVEVLTNAHPAEPGEVRAYVTGACGFE